MSLFLFHYLLYDVYMSKNKFNNKPLAIFDLDGTFFRDSLFIVITKAMCDQSHESGFLSCRLDHHRAIQEAELAWKNRTGSYKDYLGVVFRIFCDNIAGVEKEKFEKLSNEIVKRMYNQVHIFSRELFNVCREKYYTVALTGSQVETVNVFREFWPFDTVLGTVYEVDKNGKYTGKMIAEPVLDKQGVLLDLVGGDRNLLKNSVGIGDSASDFSMLEIVDKKIFFNASSSLRAKAEENNTDHINVIERKDLAWVIDGNVQAWPTTDLKKLRANIRKLIS